MNMSIDNTSNIYIRNRLFIYDKYKFEFYRSIEKAYNKVNVVAQAGNENSQKLREEKYAENTLCTACYQGDYKLVEAVLNTHKNVSMLTALYIACMKNKHKIVKFLIRHNKIKSTKLHDSPMYISCFYGYSGIVNLLLGAGYAVDEGTYNGMSTPLNIAVQEGHLKIVKLLLRYRCDINENEKNDYQFCISATYPISVAVSNGDISVVKALLKGKCNVNIVEEDGSSPVLIAARKCALEIMKLLHHNKAELNWYDDFNRGAVYYSARRGNVPMMRFLLEMKCDVNIVTSNCRHSPLFIAVENGHLDIVEMLIAAGANVDKEAQLTISDEENEIYIDKSSVQFDSYDEFYLCKKNNTSMISTIQKNKYMYMNPLMSTIKNNRIDMFHKLLYSGAKTELITTSMLINRCKIRELLQDFFKNMFIMFLLGTHQRLGNHNIQSIDSSDILRFIFQYYHL